MFTPDILISRYLYSGGTCDRPALFIHINICIYIYMYILEACIHVCIHICLFIYVFTPDILIS
jgi:hypothetical protein